LPVNAQRRDIGFPFDSTRRRFLGPRRLAPEKKGLAAEIRETILSLAAETRKAESRKRKNDAGTEIPRKTVHWLASISEGPEKVKRAQVNSSHDANSSRDAI
jgi:hypothetical protein